MKKFESTERMSREAWRAANPEALQDKSSVSVVSGDGLDKPLLDIIPNLTVSEKTVLGIGREGKPVTYAAQAQLEYSYNFEGVTLREVLETALQTRRTRLTLEDRADVLDFNPDKKPRQAKQSAAALLAAEKEKTLAALRAAGIGEDQLRLAGLI